MGRKLFAVVAAVMLMAFGVVGQTSMCLYTNGGCWPNPAAECNENWGWVFTGGTEGAGTFCSGGTYNQAATTNRKNETPPTGAMPVLGCCYWSSSGAYDNVVLSSGATDCNGGTNTWWFGIECGPDDLDGKPTRPSGTPTYDGGALTVLGCCKWAENNAAGACWPVTDAGEVADCQTGSNTYWAGATACPPTSGSCPTGTPTYDGGSQTVLGCCKWASSGECWNILTQEELTDCQGGTNEFFAGQCPGGGVCPGSVCPFARMRTASAALSASYARGSVSVSWKAPSQISSGTISLVNAKGVTVASSNVRANSSSVSAKLGSSAALPTGMYFIRIDARDVSGKRIVSQVPVQIVK